MNLRLFFSLPYKKEQIEEYRKSIKLPVDVKYIYEGSYVYATVRIAQQEKDKLAYVFLTYHYLSDIRTSYLECYKAEIVKFKDRILVRKISF